MSGGRRVRPPALPAPKADSSRAVRFNPGAERRTDPNWAPDNTDTMVVPGIETVERETLRRYAAAAECVEAGRLLRGGRVRLHKQDVFFLVQFTQPAACTCSVGPARAIRVRSKPSIRPSMTTTAATQRLKLPTCSRTTRWNASSRRCARQPRTPILSEPSKASLTSNDQPNDDRQARMTTDGGR